MASLRSSWVGACALLLLAAAGALGEDVLIKARQDCQPVSAASAASDTSAAAALPAHPPLARGNTLLRPGRACRAAPWSMLTASSRLMC